jgi:hypothetical protein
MRLSADKLKSLVRLPLRAWRRIAGLVPAMPDAPDGIVPRAKYRAGFFRTLAAPRWRTAVRVAIVISGFAIYFGMQLLLAFAIQQVDVNPLAWMFITAFFIVAISLVLAAARPTFAFIAWLVFSPLGFLFLRMDFGAGVPAITFDRIVILAITSLLLARTLIERRRIKTPLVGEWLILGFIGYTIVQVIAMQGNMNLKTLLGVISERFDHIALAVCIYYIAKSVLTTRRQLEWAVIGLVITGMYVGISAFYEHFTGTAWFSSFLSGQYRLGYEDVGMGRAAGPLINPAATGTFLGITAFLTFHLGAASRSGFAKFCCVCGTCFQLVACYFTYTRSGYVAALLLLVLLPFTTKRHRKSYAVFALAAAVAGIIIMPIQLANPDIHRRMSREGTILVRKVVTMGTLNAIAHNLWFGVGVGEIDRALEVYMTNSGTLGGIYARGTVPGQGRSKTTLLKPITSHNSILTIVAEEGLVGGVLFVGALAALLVHLFRVRARAPAAGLLSKDFMSLLIIAVISHIISTLGYDIRFFKYPSYVLWILLALGVRLGEILAAERKGEVVELDKSLQPVGGLVHA